MPAIASALGLAFYGPADPQDQLRHFLRGRPLLLVLDNLEHLLAGTGQAATVDLVGGLLSAAPGLTILTTSREALGLPGEWVLEVSGLGDHAAELFLQSARQARVGFTPAAEDHAAITRICQLVEGLPLGLELAAAWVRTLSCREIAGEIERELDFLSHARGGRPERHRSLRAVFDHSWALLTEAERRGLRRLAVFHGGFAREAAEQVAEAGLTMLSDLVAKSLLHRQDPGGGVARYDLHELVRRYALEQLDRAGEAAALRERHLRHYLDRVGESATQLFGADQGDWLTYWDREQDNLRTALSWAFLPDAPAERRALGLRLAARLDRFWQGRGHVREGCQWLECGLACREGIPAAGLAEALNTWGWLANQMGETARAQSLLAESLALYRQAGDPAGLAAALDGLGDIAWSQDDFERAQACYQESLELRRELGNQLAIGLSLYSLGRLHVDHGRLQPARALLREALTTLEKCQDQRGIGLALNGLGRLYLFEGEQARAAAHIRDALRRFQALGNRVDIAECLEELAVIARDAGQVAEAARIWGAAEALREAIGVPAPAGYYEVIAGVLRDGLGEAAFTAAWLEGRAWTLDRAVAAALEPAA
jgi:predicted ATPase